MTSVENSRPVELQRAGQTLQLFPEKAVFWKERETLILSDLHLGKSHHFQKHGIPLPGGFQDVTLMRLKSLMDRTSASRILFLGDLFHSKYNREWEFFREWIEGLREVTKTDLTEIRLVKGNHDVLPDEFYQSVGLTLCDHWSDGPFTFLHDLTDGKPAGNSPESTSVLRFSGHRHPGIRFKTTARQSITLPCFHFTGAELILPAFGELTGLHLITHNKQDEVYAIADNELFLIPSSQSSRRNFP